MSKKWKHNAFFVLYVEGVVVQLNLKVAESFNIVAPEYFRAVVQELHAEDARYREHLSLHDDYSGFDCYLMQGESAGYAISHALNQNQNRELANVFSTVTGTGVFAVQDAIMREQQLWLSCSEGMLEKFYSKHGFETFERQENWIKGKPDVLYMALRRNG